MDAAQRHETQIFPPRKQEPEGGGDGSYFALNAFSASALASA